MDGMSGGARVQGARSQADPSNKTIQTGGFPPKGRKKDGEG